MKPLILAAVIIAASFANAETNDARTRVMALAEEAFSNAMARVQAKYADAARAQQEAEEIWSNYWLAVNAAAEAANRTEDDVVYIFNEYQLGKQIEWWHAQEAKLRAAKFVSDPALVARANELRKSLRAFRVQRRPQGAPPLRVRAARGENISPDISKARQELESIEKKLSEQKTQFEHTTRQQLDTLQRQITGAQKQLRTLTTAPRGLKAPHIR